MGLLRNTNTNQCINPPAKLEGFYLAKGHFERVEQVTVGELKGKALDDALDAAGLPKTGKVAEKQARLAEHLAGPDLEDDEEVDVDEVTTTIPGQDQ